MSIFDKIANGLGTLLGVLADTTAQAIAHVKAGYEAYRSKGHPTAQKAEATSGDVKDRLREVNDEIMGLRNRRMSRGSLSEAERKRWQTLREERDALREDLNGFKEVKAAEKIFETEERIHKVDIVPDTVHVAQYNAFADTIGKRCPNCGLPMKLQWPRKNAVVKPTDLYWGCANFYFKKPDEPNCPTVPLLPDEYALMTDVSEPEFSMTADEFGIILAAPRTGQQISERLRDLKSDLDTAHVGVALATCPVHGENLVMAEKRSGVGLLDNFYLRCPRWLPKNQGCSFVDKLKSGSQIAALLKSQTGRGVL